MKKAVGRQIANGGVVKWKTCTLPRPNTWVLRFAQDDTLGVMQDDNPAPKRGLISKKLRYR